MAKKESYEENLEKLQKILSSLEDDNLNLDESLKNYEDGVKLVNKLNKILSNIESKITVIKDNSEVDINE